MLNDGALVYQFVVNYLLVGTKDFVAEQLKGWLESLSRKSGKNGDVVRLPYNGKLLKG